MSADLKQPISGSEVAEAVADMINFAGECGSKLTVAKCTHTGGVIRIAVCRETNGVRGTLHDFMLVVGE